MKTIVNSEKLLIFCFRAFEHWIFIEPGTFSVLNKTGAVVVSIKTGVRAMHQKRSHFGFVLFLVGEATTDKTVWA